jgi:catechol 2,3-dioxygenase-like lactoylglutathione lyase family enzyme
MIKGMHALFYTTRPGEVRAFIRDKLRLPYTDVGDGWLIFDVPEADLGAHPSRRAYHTVSFYCDDIRSTVKELKSRGVRFTSGILERQWGYLTSFLMPGNMKVELYQPKYKKKVRGEGSSHQMIARIWRGTTKSKKAPEYLRYLERTGLKDYASTNGNLGTFVLTRRLGNNTEFLLISLWRSRKDIRGFAGKDMEKAVYYPEDKGFLLEFEPKVRHYVVRSGPVNAGHA